MDYWAKMTLTYKSDGLKSASTFYINGSLVSNYTDYGKLMRWSDSTTLVVGTFAYTTITILFFNNDFTSTSINHVVQRYKSHSFIQLNIAFL